MATTKGTRYSRFVSYGLARKDHKSSVMERRSKRSFRRWRRRLEKSETKEED